MRNRPRHHRPVGKERPGFSQRRPERRGANLPAVDSSIIIGRNAITETLRHAPGRLARIFCVERQDGSTSHSFETVLNLAREKGVPVENVERDWLTALAGTDAHQGFGAALRQQPALDIKDFCREISVKEKSQVVLLDSVEDPQNLGSILRSAECFSVDAVIWSKNRGVSMTPSVRKAAVGASELVRHIEVSNLSDAMRKLKDAGYWIVAAEASPEARLINDFKFPEKTALVLGSEGEGMRDLTLKNSDFIVKIPLCGKINSLNVSQAAAVFMNAYAMQWNSPLF